MPENETTVNPKKAPKPAKDLTKEAKLRGWKFLRYLHDNLPPNILGDEQHPKDLTYKQFKTVMESVESSMMDAFSRDQIIFFGNLGKFRVQTLKHRIGVNLAAIRSGKGPKKIELPDRKTLKFIVNGKFKAKLNKK
jgi:nucleoid DNA-binding protein